MAEFHRDDSRLESARGPQYRTALLPWEREFCETLDISTEQYFEYHDLLTQHVKEELGRELIPDVRNDAATVSIVLTVVGLVLQGVAYLLTPKPRSPDQQKAGDPFQAQNVRGRTKFSPLAEFDSVQDLASLGALVPLIYTKRQGDFGGVRAESQLLWSRMKNLPTYQELRALILYSAGEINKRPDPFSFAFGKTRVTGYMGSKLAVWFNEGYEEARNAPLEVGESRQYGEFTKYIGNAGFKPFSIENFAHFGVITPSQSAVFGQYSPIRNGQGWKYEFKWPGKGDGDVDKRQLIYGTRRKHVGGYHAGKTRLTGSNLDRLEFTIVAFDSDRVYIHTGNSETNPERRTRNHFDSQGKLIIQESYPEGSSDAELTGGLDEGITAIQQSQQDADTALDVGELYLIGSDIYRCTARENLGNVTQGTAYEPGDQGSGSIRYILEREQEFRKDYVDGKDIYTPDADDIFDERHQPIQKVTIGSIGTTREVDKIVIGLKSVVYKQIQGYPNIAQFTYKDIADDYAKDQQSWQPGTIQTYYSRVSLFRLEIKRRDGNWFDWSGDRLFAVHGNNPQPKYNQITITPPAKDFYEFRFIPVSGNAWIVNERHRHNEVYLLDAAMPLAPGDLVNGYRVQVKGKKIKLYDEFGVDRYRPDDGRNRMNTLDHKYWDTGEPNPKNQNPNSYLQDYWFFDADTSSHANEPEHQITWLNEVVYNGSTWINHPNKQYEHLAYAGLICQSSKEISTFSNFSAYFTEGIRVKKFVAATAKPEGATNNFPEIAYDLLTNRRYGVGEYIGNNSVDANRFNVAAEFCNKNGFYWDGIISQQSNVREFLFSQAGYQLLDFTVLGGQFSLYPSVPFRSDYSIDFGATAGSSTFPIKALFTDGNVRNFKTTFLAPEERQLFQAEVKYRLEILNEFPQTHSTRVRLKETEGGYYRDPVETFDMTQFCTSRQHAINFAKYALRVRQLIDHTISFETTPDAAHTLAPGDYIRVGVSVMHQERNLGKTFRLRTGSVAPDGTLQVNREIPLGDPNGFDVYYWKPGFDGVREGRLVERDGVVQDSALYGSLFTRKRTEAEARIYKIESIAYSEESFVEITGSYTPIDENKKMRVLEWDDADFVIEDITN
jgi:hypothetical protein